MTPSQFAGEVLQLDLLPWQVELLDRLSPAHVDYPQRPYAGHCPAEPPNALMAEHLLLDHALPHDQWAATFGQRTYRVPGDGRVLPARQGELDPAFLMARGI